MASPLVHQVARHDKQEQAVDGQVLVQARLRGAQANAQGGRHVALVKWQEGQVADADQEDSPNGCRGQAAAIHHSVMSIVAQRNGADPQEQVARVVPGVDGRQRPDGYTQGDKGKCHG